LLAQIVPNRSEQHSKTCHVTDVPRLLFHTKHNGDEAEVERRINEFSEVDSASA